jgi:hypothetical protein
VSTTGSLINGLQVEYTSLDPAIASINRWTGVATPEITGQVGIVARTFAYGVAKADTVTYTVVPPTGAAYFLFGTVT